MATKKTPARTSKAAPPAVVDDYGSMAGAGYENTSDADFAIPFLAIMQSNSPQVEDDNHEAKIGDLYNTVTEELIDGKEGVQAIPCHTEHVFVEWRPRDQGGGFVAAHPLDSDVVRTAQARDEFGEYKNGENDLVETFQMYCIIVTDEDINTGATPSNCVVVSFTGTKIKPYKKIMGRLRMFKGNPPLFAHRLRFKTVAEENNFGKFRNFAIEPAVGGDVASSLIPARMGDGPHPVLVAGMEFGKQISEGLAKPAQDSVAREPGSGDDDTVY